jgi:2-dehydropantoate 2-reductase
MPEPIAVIGAGAVGTMLACRLAEAGQSIILCGRTRLGSVKITDDAGTREYPASWAATSADLPPARWAVLATKIHHTPDVADWLSALPADGGVIVAQNGVDHRQRVGRLTTAAVVPALVYPNAERSGPGEVRARATGRGLVMPDDELSRAAAALFDGSGLPVETTPDFRTASWEKLLTNVIANPITTLTGRRVEVLHEPAIGRLALDLALETVAVARADGADLTEDHAHESLAWVRSVPPTAPTSMLQDREAGKPLEHQGLIGPVVALGERNGIPTPATRAILALLAALPARTG